MNRIDFAPVPKKGWITGEGATLLDSDIPDIPGGWTGGTIWFIGWFVARTSDITTSSAGQIKFQLMRGDEFHDSYYLTGTCIHLISGFHTTPNVAAAPATVRTIFTVQALIQIHQGVMK